MVLKNIADTLLHNLRGIDTLCRFGGEEFLVLMPSTPLEPAKKAAERIREAIQAASCVTSNGAVLAITVSIGIARLLPDEDTG